MLYPHTSFSIISAARLQSTSQNVLQGTRVPEYVSRAQRARGSGKEVSETVYTKTVSQKVMTNFRIAKTLRHLKVKQKTKTLV